jgi:hypothetical protein
VRDLCTDRGECVRFFGDDEPVRFLYRIYDRIDDERLDRPRVDDFDRNVELFLDLICGLQRERDGH